jgi:hypothetical protein
VQELEEHAHRVTAEALAARAAAEEEVRESINRALIIEP